MYTRDDSSVQLCNEDEQLNERLRLREQASFDLRDANGRIRASLIISGAGVAFALAKGVVGPADVLYPYDGDEKSYVALGNYITGGIEVIVVWRGKGAYLSADVQSGELELSPPVEAVLSLSGGASDTVGRIRPGHPGPWGFRVVSNSMVFREKR